MLERERHRLIVRLVNERAIVAIGDLVEMLDASEATIRRDIATLDRNGELRRVRGGAEALNPRFQPHLVGSPFLISREVQADQKRAIAAKAAELLDGCQSIVMNAGTTTFELARLMGDRDLDVLTNSFSIAAELFANSRCRVTVPGGAIYREHNIILSPFENDASANFAGEYIFTSCYGVSAAGLTETDPMIAQAARKLFNRAAKVVVLVDSRKLRLRSSMVIAPLEEIDILITDDGAAEEDMAAIRAADIEVRIAAVGEKGGLHKIA
ncbi:MAG: transcriptional regulator [Rhizobiales bacterium 65-9]|nr:DeoR/GlpR transcriptional regulator [Hyphomicrobiales bacterium]OJY36504.1 MAG: transcriptional regulator [Rhizobiales bacterium 65-9]